MILFITRLFQFSYDGDDDDDDDDHYYNYFNFQQAVVDDCPKSQFWNGTLCISCSPCPRGFGVKTRCSPKKDTECVACHLGFDYSNTNGFERCFG